MSGVRFVTRSGEGGGVPITELSISVVFPFLFSFHPRFFLLFVLTCSDFGKKRINRSRMLEKERQKTEERKRKKAEERRRASTQKNVIDRSPAS